MNDETKLPEWVSQILVHAIAYNVDVIGVAKRIVVRYERELERLEEGKQKAHDLRREAFKEMMKERERGEKLAKSVNIVLHAYMGQCPCSGDALDISIKGLTSSLSDFRRINNETPD